MPHKNIAEWLAYIEQQHHTEMDLDLGRVRTVYNSLFRKPHHWPHIIVVGGTNGKGSCVAMVDAIASAAGYRVGSYTSPHLLQVNERIRIDGQAIGDDALCRALQRVENARVQVGLTYFEFLTLAALDIFSRASLQLIVLEVGLGGRLDAVNIMDADVAVITNVELDHCQWLGDDREKIGDEKAGIIRSDQLVVLADNNMPHSVHRHIQQFNAHCYMLHDHFSWRQTNHHWDWIGARHDLTAMPIPHLSSASTAAAIQALDLLPLDMPYSAVYQAVGTAKLPGRFQQCHWHNTTLILDGAHNTAAAQWLVDHLPPRQKYYAIFATMQDKNYTEMIKILHHRVVQWVPVNVPQVARAVSAETMAITIRSTGAHIWKILPDVATAVRELCPRLASTSYQILVTGSFYTVAAALRCISVQNTHA